MNLSEANVPARLHGADWDDFDQTQGFKLVHNWADRYPGRWLPPTAAPAETGMGLLLHGDTGVGKTTSAALAVKQAVVAHDHEAWFVSASSLAFMNSQQMSISTAMRKTDALSEVLIDDFEMITRRLVRARNRYMLLVIDDYGRENESASQWQQDLIEGLVRERFNRGLPTIITTNLSPEQIEGRFGRPWVSFMTEAFAFIDFLNNSHRHAGR